MATAADLPIRSIDWEELITIDGALSVRDAAAMLTVNGIGALIVTGPATRPAIVTERDITRAVGTGVDLDRCPCRAIADPNLVTVDADDAISVVADRLLAEGVRHVPVISGDQIVTVLSIRDVLAAVLAASRTTSPKETP